MSALLHFTPFTSKVSPEFWHEFASLKVNELQLSDEDVPLSASYAVGRHSKDHPGVTLASSLAVDGDAFDPQAAFEPLRIPVRGTLKNFNTIEAFSQADKVARFHALAREMAIGLLRSDEPEQFITRFFVLAFADLKKYKFYYLFAVPAIATEPKWISEPWSSASSLGIELLQSIGQLLPEFLGARADRAGGAFLLRHNEGTAQLARVSAYTDFFAHTPQDERIVGLIEPSSSNPGWPLRNLLLLLRARYGVSKIRVLRWLDDLSITSPDVSESDVRSLVATVSLPADDEPSLDSWRPEEASAPLPIPRSSLVPTAPQAFGWERNTAGKLGAKVTDLGPLMDPKSLADQAVGLNLKLMRWRLMPSIDLSQMEGAKFLLFGAGTLGCYVARTILGWGGKHITLLDNGKVSYSNPVRQPLYDFEDCLEGGKWKAPTAAERLRKIYPGVHAQGYNVSIPMPSHPVPEASKARVTEELSLIERLVDEHDVLFLLMDTRESRWLPTLLGAAKNKVVITAALGFDTFVVMRHGAGPEEPAPTALPDAEADAAPPRRLGCYFCNDVVAPADSLSDRTLDEMCTVSRPGLAGLAGASAVELLVSLLQHPDGVRAAASPTTKGGTQSGSCLGLVPHQVRGFLAHFNNMLVAGEAYPRCTACSQHVVDAYRMDGHTLVWNVCADGAYLERLTGLDELHRAAEMMEELELGSDDDF